MSDCHRHPTTTRTRPVARAWTACGGPSSRPRAGRPWWPTLVGVLAFAAVTQVRLAGEDDTYANLRESELIQALNGLQAATRKAERDIADLEATRDQLRSSTQRRTTALEQAQKEVQTLGVLAGTVPGERARASASPSRIPRATSASTTCSTGSRSCATPGSRRSRSTTGSGSSPRPRSRTTPTGCGSTVLVLKAPYVIDAIGNPDTLAGALQFQDGFIDDVERDNGSVTIKKPDRVDVTVTRTPVKPRYAEAVPGQ